MRSAVFTALGMLAVGAFSTSVLADGHLEKAVKARQSFMQVAAFNLGPLGGMAKGEMDYDAETASTFAKNLALLSTMNTGAMWPEGSDNEALGKKTNALPAAWAADSKVMEKYGDWAKATTELAATAGNGLDALRSGVGAVGKSCGGCHDLYRAEMK
ncbi:MAG: cytochrome c [Rhizobiales bacterium]|nr:cytochrome c [Hyphomicrobiales bacterium]